MRLSADQATPQSTEPPRNAQSENVQVARAPNRSTAQPVSGMTIAIANR